MSTLALPGVAWRRLSRRTMGGRAVVGPAVLALGVAAAGACVTFGVVRGRELERDRPNVLLGAAPLVGRDPADGWDWRFGPSLVGAVAIALLVVVAVGRGWCLRARLRVVVPVASVAASAFATALALTDGADGVLHGAAHESEYVANLPSTPPAAEFVRTFVDRIDDYSVHVRGHPPGFVLALKVLAAVGLRGPWPVALLSVAGAGVVVAAVLTTVWAVAGPAWVRRSAPFLVVAPYALWLVTSADSVFTATGAVGVAALALGAQARGRRAVGAGVVAGLLLGWLLYLTYLGAVFALVAVPLVVAGVVRRRPGCWRAAAGAVAGASAVVGLFLAAGFWWLDGVHATRVEYWEGTAQLRDAGYFRLANLAVLVVAVGPAAVVGTLRLRDARIWVLVGGAALAVAVADLSPYTRGEVERIWLPFYPWLAIAGGAAAASTGRRTAAAWVGLQAACAITLQAALVSKW